MCWCRPEIRTPFCGRQECHPPGVDPVLYAQQWQQRPVKPPYQYIVLHQALLSDIGKAAVMAAHAAGESAFDGRVAPHTYVIVLKAKSSQEIIDASLLLRQHGIRNSVVVEPDAPYHGAAIALGVAPTTERDFVKETLAVMKFELFRG